MMQGVQNLVQQRISSAPALQFATLLLSAPLQTLTMRGGGAGQGGVMDASAALRANLDAEGRVITDFSAWFTCRLLTPLQHARCNATCYPYMVRCVRCSL